MICLLIKSRPGSYTFNKFNLFHDSLYTLFTPPPFTQNNGRATITTFVWESFLIGQEVDHASSPLKHSETKHNLSKGARKL